MRYSDALLIADLKKLTGINFVAGEHLLTSVQPTHSVPLVNANILEVLLDNADIKLTLSGDHQHFTIPLTSITPAKRSIIFTLSEQLPTRIERLKRAIPILKERLGLEPVFDASGLVLVIPASLYQGPEARVLNEFELASLHSKNVIISGVTVNEEGNFIQFIYDAAPEALSYELHETLQHRGVTRFARNSGGGITR
jgi:hypothetical protein